MPTYSYQCDKCNIEFELFFSLSSYNEHPNCVACGSSKTRRDYVKDISTQNASVKKSDSELKTIGDLANRNRDRLSEDQKQSLNKKHNSYKDHTEDKPLPKGMSRMKKGKKIKWT